MTMFVLLEQSDVFVDACASDHHAQLLFLSVFGRDTSVQQLMARLHQPSSQGGVDQLTLLTHFGAKPSLQVLVGDARRLEKATGRMPKAGLLGNLVHTWIFDPALLRIDHALRSAWIFGPAGDGAVEAERERLAAWNLIKELSPVPLLDAWADGVLAHVQASGGFVRPAVLGPVSAARIELSEDFPLWVSSSVRDGHLQAWAIEDGAAASVAAPLSLLV
jgi:hypothetical protein